MVRGHLPDARVWHSPGDGITPTTVLWLVLRETLVLVAAGLAAGVLVVLVVGRYLETLLFGITPSDSIAIGGAVAILLTIAMTAAYCRQGAQATSIRQPR